MGNWEKSIHSQLSAQLGGSKESDLRFFRIAEFERMIKRTDQFSATCPYCQKLKPQINEMVAVIDQAIHSPGKIRRQYDRLSDQMGKHQRKEHGFFPPYFFSYHYSFYGMLIGSFLGTLLGWLTLRDMLLYFVLSGFGIGIVTAQIWGGRKDRKIRSTNHLL